MNSCSVLPSGCKNPFVVFCIVIIAVLFMFIMMRCLKKMGTSCLLTIRWSIAFCSYLYQYCKNAVHFSHTSQLYITAKILRALTGRGNIYSSTFQKSSLLLRMLPRRSLNRFQSTLLRRSERTTGYGERWLLENKNRELIWKSLNHTKRSFHMEVGAAVNIF